jgi:putative Holliday junction resolvase
MSLDSLLTQTDDNCYLGFDFGTKKIGVAVGQSITGMASPLETISAVNQKPNWEAISRLVKEWRPTAFVVGICYQEDGSKNPVADKILKFCRQLEGRYNLSVHTMDEGLTTYESKQLLFDEMKVNATKLWKVQDQLAATLILQSWLNQK